MATSVVWFLVGTALLALLTTGGQTSGRRRPAGPLLLSGVAAPLDSEIVRFTKGSYAEIVTTTVYTPPPAPTHVEAAKIIPPPVRPTTTTTLVQVQPVPSASPGGIWACIRQHESGGNYSINTGNGYYGAYQFLPSTWNAAVRGAGYPQYANGRADLAPPYVQDAAALWLQAHSGWGQWSTAAGCGAR